VGYQNKYIIFPHFPYRSPAFSTISRLTFTAIIFPLFETSFSPATAFARRWVSEAIWACAGVGGRSFETGCERRTLLNGRIIEKLQRELGSRFASSPPIRSLFLHGTMLRLRNEIPKHDYLLWLGKELYKKGSVVPSEMLAMEMNRVVQQDKVQKSRILQWWRVSSRISAWLMSYVPGCE
jgi:hypothetical protein